MSLTFGKRILIYSALFSRINSESLKTEKLVSRLSRLRRGAFEKVRMVSFLILLSRSDCKIYAQDMIDSTAYPENECIRNVEDTNALALVFRNAWWFSFICLCYYFLK